MKEQLNPKICDFYNTFLLDQPQENIDNFLDSHNFTFFKQLNIKDSFTERYDFYKSLYNLGCFEKPVEENGKMVDYAQKITGFIKLKLEKNDVCIERFTQIFQHMENKGFNKEFTEFFIKNYDELMEAEKYKTDFIVRCYNEFEEVQKTNTSNRGSQRQLKPTVEKFKEYFTEKKFYGLNEETQGIANSISPYFKEQSTFDTAVSIEKERKMKGTPENILGKHLSEKTLKDPFILIDNYAEKIYNNQSEAFDNLNSVSNDFTFDWLEKNDPDNFILGKLCSCCAHLQGAGYGIMRASITHPNIQTLVIRDKYDRIIAKSTLYINPKKGYGVFNNVEVSLDVYEQDKQKIYQKYMLGTKAFVDEYNKQHPDTPIKKINVGMHLNDLTNLIEKHNVKSEDLLPAVNYSKYCPQEYGHGGDSDESQFTILDLGEKENERSY